MLLEHDLAAAGTNRTKAGKFATHVFVEEGRAYKSALTCKLSAIVTLPSVKGKEAMILDTVASDLSASSRGGSWLGEHHLIWLELFPSSQFSIVFLEGFTIEVLNLLKRLHRHGTHVVADRSGFQVDLVGIEWSSILNSNSVGL